MSNLESEFTRKVYGSSGIRLAELEQEEKKKTVRKEREKVDRFLFFSSFLCANIWTSWESTGGKLEREVN